MSPHSGVHAKPCLCWPVRGLFVGVLARALVAGQRVNLIFLTVPEPIRQSGKSQSRKAANLRPAGCDLAADAVLCGHFSLGACHVGQHRAVGAVTGRIDARWVGPLLSAHGDVPRWLAIPAASSPSSPVLVRRAAASIVAISRPLGGRMSS